MTKYDPRMGREQKISGIFLGWGVEEGCTVALVGMPNGKVHTAFLSTICFKKGFGGLRIDDFKPAKLVGDPHCLTEGKAHVIKGDDDA